MNFAEKWEILYLIVNPEMEALDEETLKGIRWLRDLRNELVHYKAELKLLGKYPDGELPIRKKLSVEVAERAVRIVRTLAERRCDISPDISYMILREDSGRPS